MRNLCALVVGALILISALGGCQKVHSKPHGNCICVLFDLSVGAQDVRDRYYTDFCSIVDATRDKSDVYLVGGKITGSTEQTAAWPIRCELQRFNNLTGVKEEFDEKAGKARDDALKSAKSVLGEKAPASDIMSAFVLAEKVFSNSKYRDMPHKTLVVFTDAVEQTQANDFTQNEDLSDARIDRIIAEEKRIGHLPSLPGVTVYMVGVNAKPDPRAEMTVEKMAWVKKFWMEYVDATGAHLDAANYCPSLISFELPSPN